MDRNASANSGSSLMKCKSTVKGFFQKTGPQWTLEQGWILLCYVLMLGEEKSRYVLVALFILNRVA
jgi:hypothetical protein